MIVDTPTGKVSLGGGTLIRSVRDRMYIAILVLLTRNDMMVGFQASRRSIYSRDSVERNEKERRLQSSSSADTRAPSDTRTVIFSQSRAVFALDISGSTAGKVLKVEKDAIRTICDGLSVVRKRDAQILPWDSHAHRIIQLGGLEHVDSSGGTDPTVLLSNSDYKNSLLRSDLWFLLTDGEIDEDIVKKFALNIGAARLHGTACVVVVFGSHLDRPVLCNISVGKSVFAVTPDCLFLFHDFETGKVYVLQSKGRFRALLPEEKKEEFNIDYSTR